MNLLRPAASRAPGFLLRVVVCLGWRQPRQEIDADCTLIFGPD